MLEALDYAEKLIDCGAHFVLCNPDKRPVRKWKRPASFSEILNHAGLLGWVPGSLDFSVVDIDYGETDAVDDFFQRTRPDLTLRSKRHGGVHAYFRAVPEGVGNHHFSIEASCGRISGDVRQDKGYVIIWEHGGLKQIEEASRVPIEERSPFPLPLFPGLKPDAPSTKLKNRKKLPAPRWKKPTPGKLLELEQIFPGARYTFLRRNALELAKAGLADSDLEAEVIKENHRFPIPLPLSEVHRLTVAVIEYRSKFRKRQAERGRIGGKKSKGGGRPALTEAQPWEIEGISRRSWYRRGGRKKGGNYIQS